MWYAKMYFSGEKEFFENDAFGTQGLPSKQLELPFLESLLVWGFRIKSFHRFFLLSQIFHSRYAFAVRPVFLPRFLLPY